tara:strand:+ start:537 stop:1385 length:849 start_codon:yes stop_codon:yes gene_type:complete
MRHFLATFFFGFSLIASAQTHDLFYKTVQSDNAADSVKEELIKRKVKFIQFSKPCYWETRDSFKIDYCDSHLFLFKEGGDSVKSILVTEFFIYHHKEKYTEAFNFFEFNAPELLKTRLRPNKSDWVEGHIDTNLAIQEGIDLNKPLSSTDSLGVVVGSYPYKHYILGRDGLPCQRITLSFGVPIKDFLVDQYTFMPRNFYYQFNCKTPVYNLRILLEQEFEQMEELVEWHLENKEDGLLDSLGRLDYENHPEFFEKIYEEQINYWIDYANEDLGTNWKLLKE